MKTSDKGRAFIEQVEENGIAKLKPYNDGVGVLTIGFGHTSAAGPPKVTRSLRLRNTAEADAILGADLHSVEVNVDRLVKVPLTQAQFDTLVSFDFNTGGLHKSSALRLLNQRKYDRVPAALAVWNRGGGRVMRGLVKRRKAEARMWVGDYAGAMKIVR